MAGRTLCAGAPHARSSRCVYPRCLSPPGGTCSARLCVSPSPVLPGEPGPGTHRHGMSVDVRVTGTHASCSRPHGWAHTHGNRVRLGRPLLRAQVSASESSAVTCRDPTLQKHLRVPLFPGFRTLPSRRATSDGGGFAARTGHAGVARPSNLRGDVCALHLRKAGGKTKTSSQKSEMYVNAKKKQISSARHSIGKKQLPSVTFSPGSFLCLWR